MKTPKKPRRTKGAHKTYIWHGTATTTEEWEVCHVIGLKFVQMQLATIKRIAGSTLMCMAFLLLTGLLISAAETTSSVIRIGISAELETLDCTKNSAGLAGDFPKLLVFERLTDVLASGELKPLLATDWTVSEDGLTWTFKLREGVVFHDGTPFDANVVKANVERWLDPNVRFQRLRHLGSLAGVVVVDLYTVQLFTTTPFPVLPRVLSDGGAAMHNPKEIDQWGEDLGTQMPSGTGPYRIVDYAPRQSVKYERWDGYWGAAGGVESIEILTVPDDYSRLAMLMTGEIDVNLYVPIPLRETLEADPTVKILNVPSSRLYTIHLNHLKDRFSDVRVREALNLAVDREAIIESIYGGNALAASSMLSKGVTGWLPVAHFSYDPTAALSLLAAAGWERDQDGFLYKDGERFTSTLIATKGGYPMDDQLAQAVGEYFRAIGLDITIETPGTYGVVRALTIGDAGARETNDMVQYCFGAAHGDPGSMVNTYKTSTWSPAGINSSFYSSSRYDELADNQAATFDTAEREAILREMQEIVTQDYAVVFLLQPSFLVGLREGVEGFIGHPMEYHRISTLRTTED